MDSLARFKQNELTLPVFIKRLLRLVRKDRRAAFRDFLENKHRQMGIDSHNYVPAKYYQLGSDTAYLVEDGDYTPLGISRGYAVNQRLTDVVFVRRVRFQFYITVNFPTLPSSYEVFETYMPFCFRIAVVRYPDCRGRRPLVELYRPGRHPSQWFSNLESGNRVSLGTLNAGPIQPRGMEYPVFESLFDQMFEMPYPLSYGASFNKNALISVSRVIDIDVPCNFFTRYFQDGVSSNRGSIKENSLHLILYPCIAGVSTNPDMVNVYVGYNTWTCECGYNCQVDFVG